MRREYSINIEDWDLLFDLPLRNNLVERVSNSLPIATNGTIGPYDVNKGCYFNNAGNNRASLYYNTNLFNFPSQYHDFYCECVVNVSKLKSNVIAFQKNAFRAILLSDRRGTDNIVWNIPANTDITIYATCHIDDTPYKETHQAGAIVTGNPHTDFSFTSRDSNNTFNFFAGGITGYARDFKLYGLKATKRS